MEWLIVLLGIQQTTSEAPSTQNQNGTSPGGFDRSITHVVFYDDEPSEDAPKGRASGCAALHRAAIVPNARPAQASLRRERAERASFRETLIKLSLSTEVLG